MRHLMLIIAILSLVSCHTDKTSSHKAVSTPSGQENSATSQVNQVSIVNQLYATYGRGEIEDEAPESCRLLGKTVLVYEQFFTRRLATLIVDDRTEEVRTGDLGRINHGLLFGSQDREGIGNVRIQKESSSNVVVVLYDQRGEGNVMKMRYVMDSTAIGWRISDIHYSTRVSKG